MNKMICTQLIIFLLLVSCASSKKRSKATDLKEDKNIETNLSTISTSAIDVVVSDAIQKVFEEKLHLSINTKIYDTDKPIDDKTGKHPLKEEKKLNLNKQTNGCETDSITLEHKKLDSIQTIDKSKEKTKTETSEELKIEEKQLSITTILKFSFWLLVGMVCIILFIRKK